MILAQLKLSHVSRIGYVMKIELCIKLDIFLGQIVLWTITRQMNVYQWNLDGNTRALSRVIELLPRELNKLGT